MPTSTGSTHRPCRAGANHDLYGTLHDETAWPDPERFDSDRIVGCAGVAAFSDAYVPRREGDPVEGHRCPGQPATLARLEAAIRHLVSLRYRLEGQRALHLNRMPAVRHRDRSSARGERRRRWHAGN